jgi:hypothetical protein
MAEETHKHYHLWPEDRQGNCSCGAGAIVAVICATIALLAFMDKLPW